MISVHNRNCQGTVEPNKSDPDAQREPGSSSSGGFFLLKWVIPSHCHQRAAQEGFIHSFLIYGQMLNININHTKTFIVPNMNFKKAESRNDRTGSPSDPRWFLSE